jgi:hypothetical protein
MTASKHYCDKMKLLLGFLAVFVFSMLNCMILYSQNTFICSIKDSIWDNIPVDGLELSNGDLIIVTLKQRQDISQKTNYILTNEIIKLNKSGHIIKVKEIDYKGKNCAFQSIVKISSDTFLLCGDVIDSSNLYKLWLYEMDSSLNEIKSKIYSLGYYGAGVLYCKIDHASNILCFGTASDTIFQSPGNILLSKFSIDLDS